MDLLLSSGFLAFARHLGFLDGIATRGLEAEAIVGTSSGAMVAALHLSGHTCDDISAELSGRAPLWDLRPSITPWRGAFSLAHVQHRLSSLMPATFAELPRPLAVGVVDADGQHRLVTKGDLPAAVMASCAMPHIFSPIDVDGLVCHDGGAKDRLAVDAWRQWRPGRTGIAHWVDRTAGQDVPADLSGITVVRTPRSGAKLWSLGDFEGQRSEAHELTQDALADRPASVHTNKLSPDS